jgi:hypothetical protein
MSQNYLKIFADLLEVNPVNPTVTPDPYLENRSLTSNARMIYRMIRWSVNAEDRIGTLILTYYLGYLLEERASTPAERQACRKTLTKHYIVSSIRVYNVFSILGIQQIYRSQRSTHSTFRNLSRTEYAQILQDAMTML